MSSPNRPQQKDNAPKRIRLQATRNNAIGNYTGITRAIMPVIFFLPVQSQAPNLDKEWGRKTTDILERCCAEHPEIRVDSEVLGGMPHIRNTRISVDYILDRLYVLGSIQAVASLFAPDINEEQVKEAIAYAQDFLEKACGSIQDDD